MDFEFLTGLPAPHENLFQIKLSWLNLNETFAANGWELACEMQGPCQRVKKKSNGAMYFLAYQTTLCGNILLLLSNPSKFHAQVFQEKQKQDT